MLNSLRFRFVAIIAPIYVVTVIVGLGAYEWVTFSDARQNLMDRLDRVASSQSIILSDALASGNASNLSLMLASIISDRDLIGVAVFDPDGTVVDSYGELSGDAELIRQLSINHADGTGFRRVGALRLVMSDQELIMQARDRLIVGSMFALLLFITVMAGAVIAYNRIIARPLSQLLAAFRKPGIDDVRTITWESRDEMGELSAAFNEMICRLDLYKERLRDEQSALEVRVEERTKELADAMTRAEAANSAKTRFMSSMSHELRTPLNSILGFGQLLQFDADKRLSVIQHDHVRDILRSGNILMGMVADILDFTRIEEGDITVELRAMPLAELIEESVTSVSSLARERQIHIHNEAGDVSMFVRADYTRLVQALNNLLSNAVKYSPKNADVIIQVSTPGAKTVRISIVDHGPGIPPEHQTHLFEPFTRLGAELTEIEGTGIGLTITKRIVELMNGEVGVDSTLGKGSTFWIDIPIAEYGTDNSSTNNDGRHSETTEKSGNTDTRTEQPALTVLYVEDHQTNARLLSRIIDHVENTVMTHTETAEDGLLQAIENTPDLIITDINLPGISGFDLFDEVKRHERLKTTPVVALSADGSANTLARAKKAGFERYLTKPMNIPEIIAMLEYYRAEVAKNGAKSHGNQSTVAPK